MLNSGDDKASPSIFSYPNGQRSASVEDYGRACGLANSTSEVFPHIEQIDRSATTKRRPPFPSLQTKKTH